MSKVRMFFAAVACSVGALLVGGQAFSAGDEGTEYSLVIKQVEVKKTKADDSSWDIMDGAPDLFVRVQNASEKGSKSYDTEVYDDTYTATFKAPLAMKFRVGHKIDIYVIDKDVAANDEVGKITVNMTEKVLKESKIRLENFGRVIFLEIEAKKL